MIIVIDLLFVLCAGLLLFRTIASLVVYSRLVSKGEQPKFMSLSLPGYLGRAFGKSLGADDPLLALMRRISVADAILIVLAIIVVFLAQLAH